MSHALSVRQGVDQNGIGSSKTGAGSAEAFVCGCRRGAGLWRIVQRTARQNADHAARSK